MYQDVELVEKNNDVFLAGSETIIPPPQFIKNYVFEQAPKPADWIDYTQHPAYAKLIQTASFGLRVKSSATFAKFLFIVCCKRLIGYEQISAHLRRPKSLGDVGRLIVKSMRNIFNHFRPITRKSSNSNFCMLACSTLQKQGICVFKTNPTTFANVVKLSLPAFDKLRELRKRKSNDREFSESRLPLLRPDHKDLFAAVTRLLTESGVLETVSTYLGRTAQIVDITPQINDCSDDFWRKIFPDLAIDMPTTAYFHRDASGGDVKAILYLSDVGPNNGPFSFIVGSQAQESSAAADILQEINDFSGFSATELGARKLFSALPSFLRRKCSFGNDVMKNTPLEQNILASEWKVTGFRGQVVVFDSKGIHRGGMVLEKERMVITCVLG